MFGVDTTELLVVAVVALFFIGPKDLPRVMMTVGRWVGKVRGMARHFTAGIENVCARPSSRKWRRSGARRMSGSCAQYPGRRRLSRAGDARLPPHRDEQPTCRSTRGAGRRSDTAGGAAAAVKDIDETKAPLLDHLIELRRRLLWCVAALIDRRSSSASISPSRSSPCWSSPCSPPGRASSSTPTFSKPSSSK